MAVACRTLPPPSRSSCQGCSHASGMPAEIGSWMYLHSRDTSMPNQSRAMQQPRAQKLPPNKRCNPQPSHLSRSSPEAVVGTPNFLGKLHHSL